MRDEIIDTTYGRMSRICNLLAEIEEDMSAAINHPNSGLTDDDLRAMEEIRLYVAQSAKLALDATGHLEWFPMGGVPVA